MFLGIDLGTSGLRALLTDEIGQALAVAEESYAVQHLHPGWSEQDPADWITACTKAVSDIKKSVPKEFRQLKGIGVSGQMHGATLLDKDGNVLRPCILWNDTRSHKEAKELDKIPAFRNLSGNIVFPGFTAPKLAWLRSNEPEVFNKIAKVLLPKDYLNFWLTGVHASDMSDSAGTSWLNVGAREWSQSLLDQSGMSADQMPQLFEGSEPIGTLRESLASDWGVGTSVVVAAGGGDNAVAACGVGALAEGDGFVSLGTSGVLLAARDSFCPAPESAVHTFCHAVPDRWYQMSVILAATDSLNWLSRNLGETPEALTRSLGNELRGPGTIQFLPYLSGERTPHNDSSIRGAFLGLDISAGKSDLTRAVLGGVAFALRDGFEALKSTGANLDRLLAIGGGSNSRYWLEMLATVLKVPVDLPEAGDFGAALGAARLARCAATGESPSNVMTKPTVIDSIQPNTGYVQAYDEAYEQYRTIYPAIKAIQ